MNTQNLIRNLLLASLSASWAGLVVAQDVPFTIQGPVDLRDMHPDILTGEISCQVMDGQDTPMAGGTAHITIDRHTRSFNSTVPVSAQLVDGRSPLDARNYKCVLYLKDYRGGVSLQPGTPSAQGNTKFEPASGAPFTPVVSGPIPSSLPGIQAPVNPVKGTLKPR